MTATDGSGRTLTLRLTGGRVTELTDPAGSHTQYEYDAGRPRAQRRPARPRDHLRLRQRPPAPHAHHPDRPRDDLDRYDADGRVVATTNPHGGTTTFAYSDSGARVTEPDGLVTDQTYTSGLLTNLVIGVGTASAQTYRYEYDPATLGRIRDVAPDGTVTSAPSTPRATSSKSPTGYTGH